MLGTFLRTIILCQRFEITSRDERVGFVDKLLETLRVECVGSFVEYVFSKGVFLYWLITRDGLQDRTSYQVGGLRVVLGYESDLCILCGGYAYGKCGVMRMYVCGCGPSVGPPGAHSGVLLAVLRGLGFFSFYAPLARRTYTQNTPHPEALITGRQYAT